MRLRCELMYARSAKALLDEEYPGWEFSPGDPSCQRETTLSDDFDGDGKEDYAVMLKLKRSVSIIVLLADGEGYKSREVKRGLGGTSSQRSPQKVRCMSTSHAPSIKWSR